MRRDDSLDHRDREDLDHPREDQARDDQPRDDERRDDQPRDDDERAPEPQPMTLAGGTAISSGGGETTGQHVRDGRLGVTGGSLGSTADIVEHAVPEVADQPEEREEPEEDGE